MDISSPLTIVSCISFYTSEQYTIKIFNSSDQNFDLLFAPTEFAFNAWFGSLDRDQLLPEVTLGFLEKDLLAPEDSSFSLGIQLGTLFKEIFSNPDFEAIYLFSVNTYHTSAAVKCIP